jgi:demethylmenaquinone methyltransferase/2-methoxy-6-polyprenyl-1,4-benzoquinol methylase
MGLTDPANNLPDDHARRVRDMFARISSRYDLLNHLLSANIDKRWRRITIRKLQPLLPGHARALDVACGTGDLSIEIFEHTGANVIGLDFCRPMLELARQKTQRIDFVEGDALRLPFTDGTFDLVTIGFGLRNLSSIEAGLNELSRILKPGGWVAILEFSQPTGRFFRTLVSFYYSLVPRFGGLVSGSRSAYQYLPDTISRFPNQEKLAELMRGARFAEVSFENLTGGIAALHIGRRD